MLHPVVSRVASVPRVRTVLLGLGALAAAVAASAGTAPALRAQNYRRTDLVADRAGAGAANVDPHLVNAGRLARATGGVWWVTGTGHATLYNGTGQTRSLVVAIPPNPAKGSPASLPAAVASNGGADFALVPGQPAKFVFFSIDGTISGWNPQVNPTVAQICFAAAAGEPAMFTGGTIAGEGASRRLYAADFASGQIRVFDAKLQPLAMRPRAFRDPSIPPHFHPFNVQNVGGQLFVTYARVGANGHDEDGPGLGYVDVFSLRGRLLFPLEHGDWFNAPWGVIAAPGDFGALSHRILIGQFGSGRIASFDAVTGKFEGLLRGADNQPVVIPKLWNLAFGDGSAGPEAARSLYYAAGPNGEKDDLFGVLTPVEADLVQGSGK